MDRITRAVDRLWGNLGAEGRLHATPRFADELEAQCNGKLALHAPQISKWTFGQQLEHLFRSSHYVIDRLQESMTPDHASDSLGPWGHSLMVAGFIPRGMFPTIPQLVPGAGTMAEIEPLRQSLRERLAAVDWSLVQIKASPGKSKHPRMKWMTSSQWMFFADVHHRHHLRILRDIARKA